jgi:hypothetical protein
LKNRTVHKRHQVDDFPLHWAKGYLGWIRELYGDAVVDAVEPWVLGRLRSKLGLSESTNTETNREGP